MNPKWEAHYLWRRAQGYSVREVIEWKWETIERPHNWAKTILCFISLASIRAWRFLPGLWVLVRDGRFMYRLWYQWTDAELRPLPRWPTIYRKAILHRALRDFR